MSDDVRLSKGRGGDGLMRVVAKEAVIGLDSTTTSSLVKLVSPFFGGTPRVVFSGCGCVLRLRPSRFLFFSFSSDIAVARRVELAPLFPSFPSSSLPCVSLQLLPLFRLLLSTLLMLLAFSAEHRPRPLRVSLRLPPVLPPSSSACMPRCVGCPPEFFFSFFLVSLMLT